MGNDVAFGVVIPLFNKQYSIVKCLESVFLQTCRPNEIVVVDDLSTDLGVQEVKNLRSNSGFDIKLICKAQNGGVSSTRNLGVSYCESPYVAFLDADDFWHANHLEMLKTLINKFPYSSAYTTCSYDLFAHEVIKEPNYFDAPDLVGELKNFHKSATLGRSPVNSSSVCIPVQLFKNVGGFDESEDFGEDLMLWSKLATYGDIAWSGRYTVTRNHVAENRSNNKVYKQVRRWKYLDAYKEDLANVSLRSRRMWVLGFVLSRELRRARLAAKNGAFKQATYSALNCIVTGIRFFQRADH